MELFQFLLDQFLRFSCELFNLLRTGTLKRCLLHVTIPVITVSRVTLALLSFTLLSQPLNTGIHRLHLLVELLLLPGLLLSVLPPFSPVSHEPEEDTSYHGVHHEDEAVHEGAGIPC